MTVKVSRKSGHRWVSRPYTAEEKSDLFDMKAKMPTHRVRSGNLLSEVYTYCERCGWGRGLNYAPPDDWLRIIRAPPNCELYMVSQVQES